MKKTVKTTTPETVSVKQSMPIHGLWGVLLLFVIASIAYSTYTLVIGTTGLVTKIGVIPQATFAAILAIYKFYRK